MLSNEQQRFLLEKYVEEAVDEMRRRIRSEGLIMTGEMFNSFRVSATENGKDYVSKRIESIGYLRMKDMRTLNYVYPPPIASMEYFVESIGLHKFYYVPGYKDGKWPSSDEIAIKRIAKNIQMSFVRKPTRTRSYRGIYSASISKALSGLKSAAGQEGARFAIRYIKNILIQP